MTGPLRTPVREKFEDFYDKVSTIYWWGRQISISTILQFEDIVSNIIKYKMKNAPNSLNWARPIRELKPFRLYFLGQASPSSREHRPIRSKPLSKRNERRSSIHTNRNFNVAKYNRPIHTLLMPLLHYKSKGPCITHTNHY